VALMWLTWTAGTGTAALSKRKEAGAAPCQHASPADAGHIRLMLLPCLPMTSSAVAIVPLPAPCRHHQAWVQQAGRRRHSGRCVSLPVVWRLCSGPDQRGAAQRHCTQLVSGARWVLLLGAGGGCWLGAGLAWWVLVGLVGGMVVGDLAGWMLLLGAGDGVVHGLGKRGVKAQAWPACSSSPCGRCFRRPNPPPCLRWPPGSLALGSVHAACQRGD
jgi:hypothetical protein